MAHDFAKQRAARANRSGKPPPSPWLWLASGIVIGTLVSFLVYLATLAPQPQQPSAAPEAAASAATAPPPADTAKKKPAKPTAAKPEFDFYEVLRNTEGAATAKAPEPPPAPPPAPLPKGSPGAAAPVDVPEPNPPTRTFATTPAAASPATAPRPPAPAVAPAPPPAAKPAETAKPAGFAMQAGAFSRRADADRRRGEILLLGYDARIEPVRLPDGQTRYRVTVGPFADAQAMAHARRALRDVGIESM
jgi:cell division septation protein DedD